MFLMSDYDTIQQILKCDEIPSHVEREYEKRIKMKHVTSTGPLGVDACVAMLRALGYEAGTKPAALSKKIDWREIVPGTHVEVEDETGPRRGEYQDCIDDGHITVLFPPDDYVYEFPAHQVRILSDQGIKATADDPIVEPVYSNKKDRADKTEVGYEPVMAGDWSEWEPGQACHVELDGDIAHGEYVEIGPHDGEVQVYINGELTTVPEGTVIMAD